MLTPIPEMPVAELKSSADRETPAEPLEPAIEAAQTNSAAVNAVPDRLKSAGRLLVLHSRAMSHDRFAAAAASVGADLAALLRCERVSFGLSERQGVRVTTVSGVSDLRVRQEAVLRIANAMQEALDQRCTIVHPLPPETASTSTLAHAALAEGNGQISICTLPIISGDRAVAVLLLERRDGFDVQTLQMAKDAALFLGPVLVLQHRAEGSLQARWEAVTGGGSGARGYSPWRLAALAAAIAFVVLAAWPTTYRVVASARVEGDVQRVIAAPMDGFVRAVAARPGETVKADQVIVQMDDQDLNLEREKWESEIARLDKLYRDALSREEAAPIVNAASVLEEARAQLSLAQRQLERTALRAPFDGYLISGDLSHSIGMPVKRGQELITIASERAVRIVAEVDEKDVAALQVGQQAQALFAALEQPVAFTVTRIAPIATTADARNVFEVEGQGSTELEGLRPGLRGVAKIDIEPSFVGVVWWERASQWLRQTAWRLVG